MFQGLMRQSAGARRSPQRLGLRQPSAAFVCERTALWLLFAITTISADPAHNPPAPSSVRAVLPYTIVGTGQTHCYDDRHQILQPKPGQPFYGQDAQHPEPLASYKDNGDGTVSDLNTGLIWEKARGQKVTWEDAVAGAEKCRIGGFSDWRMPSIKELYSLINFDGGCAGSIATSKPYIDTRYFEFIYGDESAGVRIIDCQDWSGTTYLGKTMHGNPTAFGINFADGRIKGYPKSLPGGRIHTLYVRYVRGNPSYGNNDFQVNSNDTITDRATDLMWSKDDSDRGMNWQDALAWVQKMNVQKHLGYSDWRLPNAKELQSIVDYTRSPSETHSAAITPVFRVTKLSDGDYPFYWTSTNHLEGPPDRRGGAAVYIAFGRATGWMQPRPDGGPPKFRGRIGGGPSMDNPPFGGGGGMVRSNSNHPGPGGMDGPPFGGPGEGRPGGDGPQHSSGSGNYQLMDVHGAGAQRSDPKSGDPKMFPHGRGPQGDVIRIYNYVRCVRSL